MLLWNYGIMHAIVQSHLIRREQMRHDIAIHFSQLCPTLLAPVHILSVNNCLCSLCIILKTGKLQCCDLETLDFEVVHPLDVAHNLRFALDWPGEDLTCP